MTPVLLIASADIENATQWREEVAPGSDIYEMIIHDRHSLDQCLKKRKFDVLIIDKDLLGEQGVSEISSLKDIQPNLHIVVMAKNPDEQEEISAILFGAKAYCSFDINLSMLPKVITTVLANELWVDRRFVSRLIGKIEGIIKVKHHEARELDQGVALLTPRECEIAILIAAGATNRNIAEQLGISERTVKAHLGVIFRKIQITDRLQLALYMNRYEQLASIWHAQNSNAEPKIDARTGTPGLKNAIAEPNIDPGTGNPVPPTNVRPPRSH